MHVVGKAERGETGVVEIVGAVVDVTATKLSEIELRRSKAHLADAQRLSRIGSVGLEVSTKRIFWSDEAARIYGYPPGTEPTPDLILCSDLILTMWAFSQTFWGAQHRADTLSTGSIGC